MFLIIQVLLTIWFATGILYAIRLWSLFDEFVAEYALKYSGLTDNEISEESHRFIIGFTPKQCLLTLRLSICIPTFFLGILCIWKIPLDDVLNDINEMREQAKCDPHMQKNR